MARRDDIARAIRGDWGDWDKLTDARKRPFLSMADRVVAAEEGKSMKEKLGGALKKPSVGFVGVVTTAGGYALGHLGEVAAVLAMLPPELRMFIPLPIMAIVFAVYLVLRFRERKA